MASKGDRFREAPHPTPYANWHSPSMMHNSQRAGVCFAKHSNLGSPLGELCIIGLGYGQLRMLARTIASTQQAENSAGIFRISQ